MEYYLGIDIGASSGRHILAHLEQGKLKIEEIYRFENGIKKIDGEYCWDIAGLFNEVKNGIKKCKSIGRVPKTVGIDTWGVDFVLLDEKDTLLGNA
ncbi:FGGY family carbohydrate kinase, partial [Clostridium luticellarii]